MEETKVIIEDYMDEHNKLWNYASQLDPMSEEYREVKKALAQNDKDMIDIQHEEIKMRQEADELEFKKKELENSKAERKSKFILTGITIVGGVIGIMIQAKCNDHSVDRIYGYETEAIMPQNKLNMVMNKPPKMPLIR